VRLPKGRVQKFAVLHRCHPLRITFGDGHGLLALLVLRSYLTRRTSTSPCRIPVAPVRDALRILESERALLRCCLRLRRGLQTFRCNRDPGSFRPWIGSLLVGVND
jgi:hypothetical protein